MKKSSLTSSLIDVKVSLSFNSHINPLFSRFVSSDSQICHYSIIPQSSHSAVNHLKKCIYTSNSKKVHFLPTAWWISHIVSLCVCSVFNLLRKREYSVYSQGDNIFVSMKLHVLKDFSRVTDRNQVHWTMHPHFYRRVDVHIKL